MQSQPRAWPLNQTVSLELMQDNEIGFFVAEINDLMPLWEWLHNDPNGVDEFAAGAQWCHLTFLGLHLRSPRMTVAGVVRSDAWREANFEGGPVGPLGWYTDTAQSVPGVHWMRKHRAACWTRHQQWCPPDVDIGIGQAEGWGGKGNAGFFYQ